MKGHGLSHPLEMVETVLEVADVAWNAIEHRREGSHKKQSANWEKEIESIQVENSHLKELLRENLNLLQQISQFPSMFKDCPPDLYSRLEATVDSSRFLSQLELLQQSSSVSAENCSSFGETTGEDLVIAEKIINVGTDEPSLWVWITDDMVPNNVEEWSGIDREHYVIINEEHVVDGIANFIARCVLTNPKSKNLTPKELQKGVAIALGGMKKWEKISKLWHAGKLIYALSTWGLALTGLYRHRAILKMAAKGVGATGKAVLKAI